MKKNKEEEKRKEEVAEVDFTLYRRFEKSTLSVGESLKL